LSPLVSTSPLVARANACLGPYLSPAQPAELAFLSHPLLVYQKYIDRARGNTGKIRFPGLIGTRDSRSPQQKTPGPPLGEARRFLFPAHGRLSGGSLRCRWARRKPPRTQPLPRRPRPSMRTSTPCGARAGCRTQGTSLRQSRSTIAPIPRIDPGSHCSEIRKGAFSISSLLLESGV